ncbi:hypothetical protein HYH03_006646 [Edaphochlamys debaryana]|uniref:Uncharacterized protein n=1 Tax=Edaphochlamys debaryana TaxID=47281 RepID=A0A835Y3R5_9CHLO|nr:hypothetical protein HYH03_006646 [Edaphochlamys debaryana]|eukprot:KAG2495378.1 hypothetical protein HYH03_006646 [Edaphochlamys debaryana]
MRPGSSVASSCWRHHHGPAPRPCHLRVCAVAAPPPSAPPGRTADTPLQSNILGRLASQGLPPLPLRLRRDEAYRQEFREIFSFEEWEQHRSTQRFMTSLFSIPKSNTVINALPNIAWVGLVSLAAAAWQQGAASGALPEGLAGPHLGAVGPAAAAFAGQTSFALSMLLVFRTANGYGRWDEARKMWGGLLNRTRDLNRAAAAAFPEDQADARRALARWSVAFARCLRLHLQPEATLETELRDTGLTPAERALLEASQHRPVTCIQAMSGIVFAARLRPADQLLLSSQLNYFHDVLGGCERLLRAPIPLSYTRHTGRFLFAILTALPLALAGSCGWTTVPLCCGVAWVLCGIEEIGMQCEEPFGVLPLEALCDRIQADAASTLEDDADTRAVLAAAGLPGALVVGALPHAPPAAAPQQVQPQPQAPQPLPQAQPQQRPSAFPGFGLAGFGGRDNPSRLLVPARPAESLAAMAAVAQGRSSLAHAMQHRGAGAAGSGDGSGSGSGSPSPSPSGAASGADDGGSMDGASPMALRGLVQRVRPAPAAAVAVPTAAAVPAAAAPGVDPVEAAAAVDAEEALRGLRQGALLALPAAARAQAEARVAADDEARRRREAEVAALAVRIAPRGWS